ncbi:MAG: pantoate--beta-alanine ligase, partial [Cytophagales bacterium]|nr:pantoate--beta-alanine ligase [Cytophagales bacterium]
DNYSKLDLNMEVIRDKKILLSRLRNGKRWGIVPTMGGLHAGHKGLIDKSVQENEGTVCSLFVNPTQFNNSADYNSYPRDWEKDKKYLREWGCDIVFFPSEQEMYPVAPRIELNFGRLSSCMEGKSRPGHFQGVSLVLCKIFHLLPPGTRVYMGQKDWQQCRVVSQLIDDLGFFLDLRILPTVRHPDGLAYSSRNVLLSPKTRPLASLLYKLLIHGKNMLLGGESLEKVKEKILSSSSESAGFRLDYFEIVDAYTLEIITFLSEVDQICLAIAGWVDGVRLIDNVLIEGKFGSGTKMS